MTTSAEIQDIRSGAAALTELLAAGVLGDAELDQAASLLATYRRARMELEREERAARTAAESANSWGRR